DVVHVSMSHVVSDASLVHTHTRAVITGETITFEAPSDTCSIASNPQGPDSPATYVDPNGTVWDATGFVASGGTNGMGDYNEDVFLSPSTDNGAAWTNSFSQTTVEVVMSTSNARAFFNAGGIGAIWEDGAQDPNPSNLHFSVFGGGKWSAPSSVFDKDNPQDPNDWGSANLTTSSTVEAHIVRALLAGGYEHAYGVGTNGTNAAAPPALPRSIGNGVVVLADPSHLAAFDVQSGGALVASRWNGSAWSPWSAAGATSVGASLSGYCPNLDVHPEAKGCAVLWTTSASDGSSWIAGTLVSVR
ncbi:MAG TPA: hypothetical protein VH054_11825, partial [Polyangiaceae bacterium]|nr:hypothetical protein [Polyangiaceae bacterium]